MSEKLGRYLETYKRIFFKGEIENPKSVILLQKKRISLGLNEEETDSASEELLKKLSDVVDFIENMLEFSDFGPNNNNLDDSDNEEIVEFWTDLGLSDEDGGKCLNIAKEKMFKKFQEEIIEDDVVVDAIVEEVNHSYEPIHQHSYNESEIEVATEEEILEKDFSKDIEHSYEDVSYGKNSFEKANVSKKNYSSNYIDTGIIITNKKEKTLLEEYKDIITKNKNKKTASMQVSLLNLVITYGLGFEDDLFKIDNRREVTAPNMVSTFKTRYYDFLDQLMVCLKEGGVIDLDCVPDYNLEEFFNYEIILKYAEKIEMLNKSVDAGEDETTFSWLARSTIQLEDRKIIAKLTPPVIEYVVKIIRNCKGERKSISNEQDFKAFKVIDDILVMMVANLTNRALYNINELVKNNIYDTTLDLIQIIDHKQKALVHLEELKKSETKSDEKKYTYVLISALKEYPYLEDAHLKVIDILSKNDMSIRKYLLEHAYKVIEPAGECCNSISNELVEMGNQIYTESIEQLNYDELEFDELRGFCENLQSQFNITDANTIIQTELNNFGRVISVVNYKNVNEDLRTKLYRKSMVELKNNDVDIEERNNRCAYLREHYNIEDDKIIIDTEFNNFGTIISEDIEFSLVDYEIRRGLYENKLNDLQYEYDQDKLETEIIKARVNYKINLIEARDMELVKYGRWFGELELSDKSEGDIYKYVRSLSQNILMQPIDEDKKSELLNHLKEKSGFSTHEFYALQNKIGNVEMSLNDEDSIELQFIEKALEIFAKYPNMILEDKLCSFKDEDFHCGVFIRNFEKIRKELRDKELFTLRKENNKDGFLITSKAIYHSTWEGPILLKDIKRIIWREKSEIKNGQRYFRPYIFLSRATEEYKIDFIGFRQADTFKNFLTELVNSYKLLLGDEICRYEEYSVKSNSLELEEMLDDNRYFIKYKGKVNSEVEVSIYANKTSDMNVRRYIKFQQPNARLDGKIKNAMNSYAKLKEGEKPVLCFDSTIFKSGKEGFLLSTKGVHCKNKFGSPWFVSHEEMKFIKVEEENLIFNDKQTSIITIEEAHRSAIRDLLEFLSFMFKNMEIK